MELGRNTNFQQDLVLQALVLQAGDIPPVSSKQLVPKQWRLMALQLYCRTSTTEDREHNPGGTNTEDEAGDVIHSDHLWSTGQEGVEPAAQEGSMMVKTILGLS